MQEKKPTKLIIIEKAIDLFSEKGYTGTSMEDIAKAVGIRKASLYSHMPGKECIFTTIFDMIVDEYMEYMEKLTAVTETQPAGEKLRDIFYHYVHYNRSNARMKFWDRFYYFPPEPLKDYIYSKTDKTGEYFERRISAVLELGVRRKEFACADIANTAMTFYYLLIGFVMSTTYVDRNVDQDIERCVSIFLNGICLKPAKRS